MAEGKVFLIRHGQTSLNKGAATSQDRVGAWTDNPLSAEGRKDAERASREIADEPIALVFSSDLKRGEQTAAVIAKAHGAQRRSSPALRSWNLGELAGKPFSEARPVIEQYASECPDRPVPGGGESFAQFKGRALPAVRRVLAQAKAAQRPVVLVSHVRVLQLIRGWLEAGCKGDDVHLQTFLHDKGLGPGAVVELAPAAGKWTFTVIDPGAKRKSA